MADIPDPHTVIHLPIDVQEYFYRGLSSERRRVFPAKVATFSYDLWERGIETVPVAFGIGRIHKGIYRKPFPNGEADFFKALTIKPEHVPPECRAVYVKDQSDAFWCGTLAKVIDRWNIETILVTGMNTTACVEKSILGALKHCGRDVCVTVVYDLLADVWKGFNDETSPLSHGSCLNRGLSAAHKLAPGRLGFSASCDVLKQYKPLSRTMSAQIPMRPSPTTWPERVATRLINHFSRD